MGGNSAGTNAGTGWLSRLSALSCLFLAASGCILADGKIVSVHQDPPGTEHPTTPNLVAAVNEVDITPPPGLPTYGYSTNGVKEAKGYWLRLKGRILALEKQGTLVVLIQADLGASSALVHRLLAEKLAPRGITPGNLMLATTHTHGGPGGFFGDKFYNKSVGAKPAYIPEYVAYLVDTLAEGTTQALDHMLPAKLGVASASAGETATFNRSIEAWRTNYLDQGIPPDDTTSVDRRLYLLRVDIANGTCKLPFCPAGSWSVFAVHGTSMPQDYPLHHGDVHGLAARLAARWIERDYGVTGFVAATATGAEGDVSPGTLGEAQGKPLAMRAATAEAGAMYSAFRSLDDAADTDPAHSHMRDDRVIRFAYREESMRGAITSRGRLCDDGALGAAEAAGSEASQGPLNGFLEMAEGATGLARDCQSTKIKFLGDAQDLFYNASEYPDILSFQVVTFGEPDATDSLVLAAFPGEPTTEIGRAVRREIQLSWPASKIAVVGLTNSYAMYFTTPSEYRAQHYEGGTTLYGPFQGIFGVEQLGIVARWALKPDPGANPNAYIVDRTFQPGEDKPIWPKKKGCVVSDWKAGDLSTASELVGGKRITRVTFAWTGMKEDENCAYPNISVHCPPDATGSTQFYEEKGFPASDEGYGFEVARDCDGETWRATWDMRGEPGPGCTIVVAHPALQNSLISPAFSVGK